MKQRVRVIGIAEISGDFLCLKKARMRKEPGEAEWELPVAKINFTEQPEEALARTLMDGLGVTAEEIKLIDAITMVSPEGASRQSNLYIIYRVKLPLKAKIEPRGRWVAYKWIKQIDEVALEAASKIVLGIIRGDNAGVVEMARATANAATVRVDGCSRGNPGVSGVGYYITGENGEVLKKGGKYIGFATSRLAEYIAMKEGMEQALELGLRKVKFISDSQMLINQLNGLYKLKNLDLMTTYSEIKALIPKFEAVTFIHQRREKTLEADRQANLAVDRQFMV